MDFSRLDLEGLHKARADIMAASKACEMPPNRELLQCIDRLIDRALKLNGAAEVSTKRS